MKSGVTREQLIKSLEDTLKLTRRGVESLTLQGETVTITYEGGDTRKVCIAADSGIAIIIDVTRAVYCS